MVSTAMAQTWDKLRVKIMMMTAKMEQMAKEKEGLRMTLRAVTSNVITVSRPICHTLPSTPTLNKSILKVPTVNSELHQQVVVEEAVQERT